MKRVFLTICFFALAATGFGQGIEFFKGSYEEALLKAKNENKDIFVDVFTTWCSPCKRMAKEVFTDRNVGEYFNKKFVCIQLDAENEASSSFFKTCTPNGYPGLFWMDSNNTFLGSHTGYIPAEQFVKIASTAVDSKTGAKLAEAKLRWDNGERGYGFINEYVSLLSTVNSAQVRPFLNEYLGSLTDEQLKDKECFELMSKFFMSRPVDDIIFRKLLHNADIYMDYGNRNDIMIEYYRLIVRNLSFLRDKPDEYEKMLELIKSSQTPYISMYLEILDLEKMLFARDYSRGIKLMSELAAKYESEHPYLYGQFFYTLIISGYFKSENDGQMLDNLLSYSDRMMRLSPCQESLLYLSAVYAKKGDYCRAYELLASIAFYPDPRLSNAVYPALNLPVTTKEYPQK